MINVVSIFLNQVLELTNWLKIDSKAQIRALEGDQIFIFSCYFLFLQFINPINKYDAYCK